MPHYKITLKDFPQLSNKANVGLFKKYMASEYSGYYDKDYNEFYAHNDGDSLWFLKDFFDNKAEYIKENFRKREKEESMQDQPIYK